ncbi:MAG: tetraacyldisaccharide 4'-kinase [Bacteroidales bacterium]|nr:tetraacyldisaccharide 4'-kinase [Bacteroidales bacterium]
MSFYGLLLLPLAVLYGLVTWFRNKLFDWGWLSEISHQIPIISIGNLSMGGTGKTPLTEYLIRLLQNDYKTAILSRGYGRKTKGFILADENSRAQSVGDEPMQYALKFPNTMVAVSENRNLGVESLLKTAPDLDLIILDDAFQHRFIKAGLNILLTNFYPLYSDDYVFPSGSLREYRSGAKRADIVIVTKTPVVLSPISRRRIIRELKLMKHQILLFSKIEYDKLTPYFSTNNKRIKKHYSNIILFTGIANNYPLQDHLHQFCSELTVISFPDHHIYKQKDIFRILKTYDDIFGKNKILVTSEKDIMRLRDCSKFFLFEELSFYYVPIRTVLQNSDGELLSKSVENFLTNNKRLIKK